MVQQKKSVGPTRSRAWTHGDGVRGLYAFQFDLSFDAEVLEIVTVAEGSLLGADGAQTYWYAPDVRKSGSIQAAATRIASEGISETGVLAALTFKMKTDDWRGRHPIKAGTVSISDAKGYLIGATLEMKGLDFEEAFVPHHPSLLQNYPNPFNPETWIPYQLTDAAAVVIQIYDAKGGVVRTIDLGHQPAGFYRSRTRAASSH